MKISTMQPIRLGKSQSREAYRLWFEFLKRAIAEDPLAVDMSAYAEWGAIEKRAFTPWWNEIGRSISDHSSLVAEIVENGRADESSYLIRVPKALTSTQIGNEIRRLLIETGHQPTKQSKTRIQQGVEIRPLIYRIYLHTYDQQKKLEAKLPNGKVTKRELLIALRKFYLNHELRYKNNNFKVDRVPAALMEGFDRNDPDKYDVQHSKQATANVARYLKEAQNIIAAVKLGRFPK